MHNAKLSGAHLCASLLERLVKRRTTSRARKPENTVAKKAIGPATINVSGRAKTEPTPRVILELRPFELRLTAETIVMDSVAIKPPTKENSQTGKATQSS